MEEPKVNQTMPPQGNHFSQPYPVNLPNSTAVLVLGILSLIFICPYISLVGIILGIIALVLAARDQSLYNVNRAQYTLSSYNNLKAGRVCAIIGLSIATFIFIMSILFIIGVIATATLPFWGMID